MPKLHIFERLRDDKPGLMLYVPTRIEENLDDQQT